METTLLQFKQNLFKGGIIDTNTSVGGTFVWLPDGMVIRNLFINAVKSICSKYLFKEYLFPVICSGDDFSCITNNIYDFSKGVYWLDEDKLLRPSGESIIYPQFKRWIKTYKDLPIRMFQVGSSFRKGRPRSVFRLIESDPFIEGHTAHASRQEAEEQLESNIALINEVLAFLGLPVLFTNRPIWSNKPVGERTIGFDTILPIGETILVASAYSQMQIFSKLYNIQFYDKNNRSDFTYQTSFGFSSKMLLACLFLASDSKGLIIPPQIAPHQIIIIPVYNKNNFQNITEYTTKVQNVLLNLGFRVTIDDSNKSIGDKRYLYETKGVPMRIEVGNNEFQSNTVSLFSRENNERSDIPFDMLGNHVNTILDNTTRNIMERIHREHSSKIIKCQSVRDIESTIEAGKTAYFPLCFKQACSQEVEKVIKGEVIGYSEHSDYLPCIICGQNTPNFAFQARHI